MLLRYKRVRNIQECPTSICQISIPMRKINLINSSLFFYSRALCQLVLSTLYGSNLQPSLIKIYNYGILVKTRTLSGLSTLEKKCACCIQAGIIAAIRPLMLCQTTHVYFHVTKLLMQVLEVACFQDFLKEWIISCCDSEFLREYIDAMQQIHQVGKYFRWVCV